MPVALGTIASHRTATATGPIPTTGLQLWLDADDASTFTYSSGVLVSDWRDKSGQTLTLSNGNTAYQPSRNGTQNGRTSVVYSGSQFLGSDHTVATTAVDNFTMFAAFKQTGSSPCVPLFNGNPAANGYGIAAQANSPNVGYLRGGIAWTDSTTPNPAAPCVMSFSRTSGIWAVWLNGIVTSAAGSAAPATPATGPWNGVQIPSEYHLLNGQMYEALIYDRVLSTAERQQVESYLATKWGLSKAPDEIGGLQAWYDATDNSTFTYSSGFVVSQWNDKSGNGRHMTQATVAKQPSRSGTQNGLPTVVFDGTTNWMQCATLNPTDPFTIVLALNHRSNHGGYIQQMSGWGAFSGHEYAGIRASDVSSGGTNFGTGGKHVYLAEWSTPTAAMYRDNSVKDPFLTSIGPSNFTAGTTLNMNDEGFMGKSPIDIFEVCFYNRVLSAEERQQIQTYLGMKWGTP